ncbi:ATP-binding cassette domain-containing protein [Carnobacterium gallinarum]|uniref:ATP-binding cassette domain-containing protein n=1 Tax=Carnobacterium gallinarum TaxID=2749 RepID=UPI00068AE1AA|nr:ATP-binding cassette domain-containing protein [Carnobacterium gallinarum]
MILKVANITKAYHKNEVLKNISFEIEANKITAIHGKSGAGKTTLMNIIGLNECFDSGSIELFGKPAPKINSREAMYLRRNDLSYLFQNFGLVDSESIDYNLTIALQYQKLSKKEKSEMKKQALEEVGLHYFLTKKVYQLSGGEKQRVALARVLLKNSRLILADEPTGSLDEDTKYEICELLFKQKQSKTIVLVSHDPYLIGKSDYEIKID